MSRPLSSLAWLLASLLLPASPLAAASAPSSWHFAEELRKAKASKSALHQTCQELAALCREAKRCEQQYRELAPLCLAADMQKGLSGQQLDQLLEMSQELDNLTTQIESLEEKEKKLRLYIQQFGTIVHHREKEITGRQIAGNLVAFPLLYLPLLALDIGPLLYEAPPARVARLESIASALVKREGGQSGVLKRCFPGSWLAGKLFNYFNHYEREQVACWKLEELPGAPAPFTLAQVEAEETQQPPLTSPRSVSAVRLQALKQRIWQLNKEIESYSSCLEQTSQWALYVKESAVCREISQWPEGWRQLLYSYLAKSRKEQVAARNLLAKEEYLLRLFSRKLPATPASSPLAQDYTWHSLLEGCQEQARRQRGVQAQAAAYADLAAACHKQLQDKEIARSDRLSKLLAARYKRLRALQASHELEAAECELMGNHLRDIVAIRAANSQALNCATELTIPFLLPASGPYSRALQASLVRFLTSSAEPIVLNRGNLSAAWAQFSTPQAATQVLCAGLGASASAALWDKLTARGGESSAAHQAEWGMALSDFYHVLAEAPDQLAFGKRLLGRTTRHACKEWVGQIAGETGLLALSRQIASRWAGERKGKSQASLPSFLRLGKGLAATSLRSLASALANELGLAHASHRYRGNQSLAQFLHKGGHGLVAFCSSLLSDYLATAGPTRQETPFSDGEAIRRGICGAGAAICAEGLAEYLPFCKAMPASLSERQAQQATSAYLSKLSAGVGLGCLTGQLSVTYPSAVRAIDENFLTTADAHVLYIEDFIDDLWPYVKGKQGPELERSLGEFLFDKGFAREEKVTGWFGGQYKVYRCYRTRTAHPTIEAMVQELLKKDDSLRTFVTHILPAGLPPCTKAAYLSAYPASAPEQKMAPPVPPGGKRCTYDASALVQFATTQELSYLSRCYPDQMATVYPEYPAFMGDQLDPLAREWYRWMECSVMREALHTACKKAMRHHMLDVGLDYSDRSDRSIYPSFRNVRDARKEAEAAHAELASLPLYHEGMFLLGKLALEGEEILRTNDLGGFENFLFLEDEARLKQITATKAWLHQQLMGSSASLGAGLGAATLGGIKGAAEVVAAPIKLGYHGLKGTSHLITDPAGSWDTIRKIPAAIYHAWTYTPSHEEACYARGVELLYGKEKCKEIWEKRGYWTGVALPTIVSGVGLLLELEEAAVVAEEAANEALNELGKETAKEGGMAVYRSVTPDGYVQYVGITNNFARRQAEHLVRRGIPITTLMENLSATEAKAVEQALIEIHGLGKNGGALLNKINSIAATNPVYADQLKIGYALLESITYDKG